MWVWCVMKILQNACAGTLESSDIYVEVSEGDGMLRIKIDSVVKRQFGEAIECSIREMCEVLNVSDADIYVNDRGALDCTVRARVETALLRAGSEEGQ